MPNTVSLDRFVVAEPLRSLISQGAWTAIEGPERWRSPPAEHHRTRVIARGRKRKVILCEAKVGKDFPAYSERVAWRDRLSQAPGDVVVFTDAAHSEFVWTRVDRASGLPPVYFEHSLGPAMDHVALLESLPQPPIIPSVGFSMPPGLARRLLRCGPSALEVGGEVGLDVIHRWIERSAGASDLGSLWRKLTRVVAVDPRCSRADWLLAGASTFERLYLAILSRLQSFLDDAVRESGRGGVQRYSSARRMLEWTTDGGRDPTGQTRVRRFIVQRQLFGWSPSRRALEGCRRALVSYAGWGRSPIPSLDAHVFQSGLDGVWPPTCLVAKIDREPSGRGLRRDGPKVIRVAEDVDVLRAAWVMVLETRLFDSATVEELRRAESQLSRRRHSLLERYTRANSTNRDNSARMEEGDALRLSLLPAADGAIEIVVRAIEVG